MLFCIKRRDYIADGSFLPFAAKCFHFFECYILPTTKANKVLEFWTFIRSQKYFHQFLAGVRFPHHDFRIVKISTLRSPFINCVIIDGISLLGFVVLTGTQVCLESLELDFSIEFVSCRTGKVGTVIVVNKWKITLNLFSNKKAVSGYFLVCELYGFDHCVFGK